MAMNYEHLSDHLKAVLHIGDIIDSDAPVYQADCMTVQNFEYAFNRSLDTKGVPCGPTNGTTLRVDVRVMNKSQIKTIFEHTGSMTCTEFSTMFNTTFGEGGKVKDYEDAMVVRGTIVDILEEYKSVAETENQQMVLKLQILVAKVVYLGSTSNKTLWVSKV